MATAELTTKARLVSTAIALVAFGCFIALGSAVGRLPDPNPLMSWEAAWTNHSTLVAWWLTWCGYAYVLAPVCLVLVAMGARSPWWRWRSGFAILSLLIAWRGADLFQHLFDRPRRLDWVVKHETAFSFPSSHAAIATGFYLVLAIFAWRSGGRFGRPAACLLAVLAAGILWSRLALAAHYATDLLGGILWGLTGTAVLYALFPTNVFEGRSTASLE